MGRTTSSSRPTLTIEQVNAVSEFDSYRLPEEKPSGQRDSDPSKPGYKKEEKESKADSAKHKEAGQRCTSSGDGQHTSIVDMDVRAATFLDVAVIRCLFISQWQEEGIFWALQFLYNRLRRINEDNSTQQMPRRRSNSLPIPKIEVSIYQSPESKKREDVRETVEFQDTRESIISAGEPLIFFLL